MSLVDDIRQEILFVDENRLRRGGACGDGRDHFTEIFPEGTTVSVETAVAHADKFDWYSAGSTLLKGNDWNRLNRQLDDAARTYSRASDHLYSLFYNCEVLTQDEYTAFTTKISTVRNETGARLFAEAVIRKADRAADALISRLRDLNDDELRYKTLFVTPERLEQVGACDSAKDTFRGMFGDGAEITEELCVVHANKYDWVTAADLLLNTAAKAQFKSTIDGARTAYDEIVNAARTARNANELNQWEYSGKLQMAERDYEVSRARAFAQAAIGQYETLKAELAKTEESTPDESEAVTPDVAAVEEATGEAPNPFAADYNRVVAQEGRAVSE